jgi:hypothetical protein
VDRHAGFNGFEETPGGANQSDDVRLGDFHRTQADGDRDEQRAMGHAATEVALCGSRRVHVQEAEVARDAGVSCKVGVGDGPAPGGPTATELEVFEVNEVQDVASINRRFAALARTRFGSARSRDVDRRYAFGRKK